MSLATVLYPSPTPQGWVEWTHANYQSHLAIERGLLEAKGVRVTPFRIWPIGENQFKDWLEQHQLAHNLFCDILGIQSIDLTELDWEDKTKRDFWMYAHFIQHQVAAEKLGAAYKE